MDVFPEEEVNVSCVSVPCTTCKNCLSLICAFVVPASGVVMVYACLCCFSVIFFLLSSVKLFHFWSLMMLVSPAVVSTRYLAYCLELFCFLMAVEHL